MSEASDLIEKFEKETGQRVDANDGDNMAMAGLFGALARALGSSGHDERDDIAAGVLLRHQLTPEYRREQEANRLLVELLAGGVSPDDAAALIGKRK